MLDSLKINKQHSDILAGTFLDEELEYYVDEESYLSYLSRKIAYYEFLLSECARMSREGEG